MKVMQKLMLWLSVANLIAVVYLGWMLFSPVHLPIVYNEPFPVSKEEVRRGETISYTMVIEKRRSYPVDIHKNIVCEDGNLVTLAHTNTNIPIGDAIVTPEVIIPEKTSLGMCTIEMTNEYQINGLRTEVVTMVTQPFKVIE